MSLARLLSNRFSLVAITSLFAGVFLALTAAPEAPGRAPAPAKKKDKYDQAIDRGLQWLALHQAEDGHWSLHDFPKHAREKPLPDGKSFRCNCEAGNTNRNDIAATAFGVLPFLAAGHRPGPSDRKPDYGKTVEAGLKYLVSKQAKDGSFTTDMYAHGLATQALCNAYTLTKDKALKGPAQKAIHFIVSAQDPAGGGWRYAPRQPGDLSVTGWQYVALKRGELAGLDVPKETINLANRFVDSCETEKKGGYAYTPGGPDTITMTAVGLLCREYSGVNPRNPGLLAGVSKLKAYPPEKNENIYYLYYANQVMFHLQGESWRDWDLGPKKGDDEKPRGMRNVLLMRQDKGQDRAHQAGSWGGSPGGRMMATSLSLLILQQHNQKPNYRRDAEEKKDGERNP